MLFRKTSSTKDACLSPTTGSASTPRCLEKIPRYALMSVLYQLTGKAENLKEISGESTDVFSGVSWFHASVRVFVVLMLFKVANTVRCQQQPFDLMRYVGLNYLTVTWRSFTENRTICCRSESSKQSVLSVTQHLRTQPRRTQWCKIRFLTSIWFLSTQLNWIISVSLFWQHNHGALLYE